MRVAVISDVHGNLHALEAVLADIEKHHVDRTLNLGDALSDPLFPSECADRLIPLQFPTIRGNHERQLLTFEQSQMGESDLYSIQHLQPHHLQWIASFPATLQLDDMLLVHGTPASDLTYFLETVTDGGLQPASLHEVEQRAGTVSAALILCGHTHIPRAVSLPDGRLIVNPGSVGLPAYESDNPVPHKSQTGSPHARYAIVTKRNGKWSAELHTVVYDWQQAASLAEQRCRPDWARALRTGLV